MLKERSLIEKMIRYTRNHPLEILHLPLLLPQYALPEEKHVYSSAELVTMIHKSFRKSDELLEKLKEELKNA